MAADLAQAEADDIVESDLFSPEELAMMAAASQPRTPPTPEEQIAELETQVQGLAAFIAEGVDREQKLRSKLHQIESEMAKATGLIEFAGTLSALQNHIADMSKLASEAARHEDAIRHILAAARVKPAVEC